MKHKKSLHNLVIIGLSLLILFFGVIPIMNRSDEDFEKFGYQSSDKYDVVVFGSEPEGIAAAVSAARAGMNTLLVTKEPDPGSYMTDCLINRMAPQDGRINGKKTTLTGPVFGDLFGTVESTFTAATYLNNAIRVMSKESKLEVLYDTTLLSVGTTNNKIDIVNCYTGEGNRSLKAQIFIDATEDGILLEKLDVQYFSGSSDIGAPDFFEPVAFQFRLRGVLWDDIKKIAKVNELSTILSDLLIAYPRTRQDVKLVSPALIRQDDDTVLITGLQIGFVHTEKADQVQEAYQNAIREAMHLTAYLQVELQPFEKSEWDVACSRVYVPEKKHYIGIETLHVSDILNNRDREDKVALLSEPVTAGRFVRGDDPSVLCNPNVYSVPIGCLVPEKWENLLMVGSKVSFSSLAATSAGTISSSVIIGEGAGLAASYCILEEISPLDVPSLPSEQLRDFTSFLSRAGQIVTDFSEPVMQPDGTKLSDSWMKNEIEHLVSYGVLQGGSENDFRISEGMSMGVATVLAKNTLLRIAPAFYKLDTDKNMESFYTDNPAGSEIFARALHVLASINISPGKTATESLFDWLENGSKDKIIIPDDVKERWENDVIITNGEAYFLIDSVCSHLNALEKQEE